RYLSSLLFTPKFVAPPAVPSAPPADHRGGSDLAFRLPAPDRPRAHPEALGKLRGAHERVRGHPLEYLEGDLERGEGGRALGGTPFKLTLRGAQPDGQDPLGPCERRQPAAFGLVGISASSSAEHSPPPIDRRPWARRSPWKPSGAVGKLTTPPPEESGPPPA